MGYYMSYENIPKNVAETAVLTEVTNIPRNGGNTAISVQEVNPLDIPIETSDRGNRGVAVFLQDQTTNMLNLPFLQSKATGLTLAIATIIDTRAITLTPGHGLTTANSANHVIELTDTTNGFFFQGRVVSIAGDVVTVGTPINKAFDPLITLVTTGNPNIIKDAATGVAIDGSVTPVIFKVKPYASQKGDITRLILAITSSNDMDINSFGGAAALTLALTLRVKLADGSYKNLFAYRSNFDFALHGFTINTYIPKVGNSVRGLTALVTFAGQQNHGVALRLDGDLEEELQLVVLEAMDASGAGNLSFSIIAEGSELQ